MPRLYLKLMDIIPIEETLRYVLPMFEGVHFGRVRAHSSGNMSAFIQVTHPMSLVRLAACAENANVAFYVWSNSQIRTQPGTVEREGPWYELRAEGDPPGSEDTKYTAQMFCACLIQNLRKRGVLDNAECDRLLARFDWDD